MELLRSTNRLSTYLASQGYAARRDNHAIAEAEFVSLTGTTTAKSADPFSFPFPAGLDFDLLRRVMTENDNRVGFSIDKLTKKSRFLPHSGDTSRFLSDGENVDVLWTSEKTFVTRHDPNYGSLHLWAIRLYSTTVQLLQNQLELHAYSFVSEANSEDYMSEIPLRFFQHLLTPILHLGPSAVVYFSHNRSEPPVEASLALVPTTDQCLTNDVEICFVSPTHTHMQALALHPVHKRVCLCLDIGWSYRFSPEEMNHHLLGFRQPVHLRIPDKLNGFDGKEEPFVVNPILVSLTIQLEAHPGYLSKKMIDGIAKNTNIKSLSIDCGDWGSETLFGGKAPEWVVDLFRCVVLPSRSLECLVFVANRNFRNEPKHPMCRQAAFDQVTGRVKSRLYVEKLVEKRCFSAHHVHSVSKFRLQSQPPLKSNAYWDSVLFSPALVLNCLRRQLGGSPPGSLAALAVLRINQGILYSFATNLIPCDLSASSAGATFYILRSSLFNRRCASTRYTTVTGQVM
jgi:hypothetical protein